MKNLLLFASFLLASSVAFAQASTTPANELAKTGSIDALDAKNGFKYYELGSPIKNYPGLKERGKDVYASTEENLTVGDVRLRTPVFSAYNGKLSAIAFSTTGKENCEKLLATLTVQYGQPQTTTYEKRTWTGNKVTMIYEEKITPGYRVSPYVEPTPSYSCIVYIVSNALSAEETAEKRAAAKKAASDL